MGGDLPRVFGRSDPEAETVLFPPILGGSPVEALRGLRVATLVVHGLDDTLIDPSGGQPIAELVPGTELLLVPTWFTAGRGSSGP